MGNRRNRYTALAMALFILIPALTGMILERSRASLLTDDIYFTAVFREQKLPATLYEEIWEKVSTGYDVEDILAATMLNGRFVPSEVSLDDGTYRKYKREAYEELKKSYGAIWKDLKYFPLAGEGFSYENTFLAPRYYGGERVHEGTDIFGKENISGYYPVISMTDGIVEKVGWLPLGGYRIGVRSPGGGYFYYAHLSDYTEEYQVGDSVRAGDILGFMGNTGYGPPVTRGKFPVHLHLGIYISVPGDEELSVNPYWILKCMEKNKRKYTVAGQRPCSECRDLV